MDIIKVETVTGNIASSKSCPWILFLAVPFLLLGAACNCKKYKTLILLYPLYSVLLSNLYFSIAPTGKPGLVILAATDNSVRLLFSQPECGSQNGAITSYAYYCSNEVLQTPVSNTSTSMPTAVVTGMTCDGPQFSCYAAAVNINGTGPFRKTDVDGSISSGRRWFTI